MSYLFSKSHMPDIFDEFIAHIVWFKQAYLDRNARPEIETYDQFRRGLLDEAIRKNIRTDVIDLLFREMERRFPEILHNPEPELSPETPEAGPNPNPNGAPPESSETGKDSNKAKDKKQKRRGKKKKKKLLSPVQRLGRKKGQGNLTPADFPSAIKINVKFGSDFGPGTCCPHCHDGKLETTRSPELLRFRGQSPVEAQVFILDRVRCRTCSQEFEANLPHGLSREVAVCKTSPEAAAQSLLLRYGLGFPDLRLEQLAQFWNVAFSNSRQWEIAKQVFEGLLPLYDALELFVANAELREVDDCNARIISQIMQISHELWAAKQAGLKDSAVRTGVQMTVWVAWREGVVVRWFRMGRPHQGEREYEIENKRTDTAPVVRASDAASKASAIKPFPDTNTLGFVPTATAKAASKLTTKVSNSLTAHCWEHLRQTFEKARPGFQTEVSLWMQDIVRVFEIDSETRDMTAEERLFYHQEKSEPIVEAMTTRAHDELSNNIKAEPNGAYAKALRYFLDHIKGLCLFLQVPGVPLTTSLAELAAKFTKKHHKNSLSFQTQQGGDVGAFFMALIATCLGIKENPLEYLTALIEWRHKIKKENASEWFPHNYKLKLAEVQKEFLQNEALLPYRACKRRTKAPDLSAEPIWNGTPESQIIKNLAKNQNKVTSFSYLN